MIQLTKHDIAQITKLHAIFFNEVPDFILEVLQAEEMKRICSIGQNCGRDYLANCFQNFSYNYSRCEHSIGVALIVWRFTKDVKQTLAGLFHDIATPTFSHVIDFYNNDSLEQESTEALTEKIIANSTVIQNVLKKYNLTTKDVCDYSMYPIADNKSPKLSADRLEYTCYMSTAMGLITFDDLKILVDDIYITNVDGIDEMCFHTKKCAKEFAKLAIECGRFMSSPLSTLANQFLADTLQVAIDENVLSEEDFNNYTEEDIINKIEGCNSEKARRYLHFYRTFSSVQESETKDLTNYSIRVKVKSRYIDPLCIENGNITRISAIDNETQENIQSFLAEANTKYFTMNVALENLK